MALQFSCAFATADQTHEHARIAEQLGFSRAWFYDSPALYPDVWVQLCRAAERTQRIVLGPGVLVPSLRHPMTNAEAIATLVGIAGEERVVVGIGSGFTGRMTLGQRPLLWTYVAAYIRVLRALLLGEDATWEGGVLRMLQPAGYGAPRPIHVPFVIGAGGPKGMAVARELGDGVFGTPVVTREFAINVALVMGTVLDSGELPDAPRVLAAAGHGAAVSMHYALEHGGLSRLPNGAAWAAAYEDVPQAERHLALHDKHLISVNDRDRAFVDGALLARMQLALTDQGWRERLAALQAQGVTEIAYQPAGADIPRELEAFMRAVTA